MSRAPTPLPPVQHPDLDNDALKARLAPLTRSVVPGGQEPSQPAPPPPASSVPAPQQAPRARTPRRGIEFQLPEVVVEEIKVNAARRKVTTTILMLEILKEAGYSVTDADFADLRRGPRR